MGLSNESEMGVFNFEYCLHTCKVKYERLLYDYMYLICAELAMQFKTLTAHQN